MLSLTCSFELNTYCNSTNSLYFDTSLMSCASCSSDKIPSSDYLSCICKPGYAKTSSTRDFPVFTCASCGSASVPSSDAYECQSCETTISDNDCACPSSTSVPLELQPNGDYYSQKQCVDCGASNYPGPGFHTCVACPDPLMTRDSSHNCTCPSTSYTQSMDSCISNSEVTGITGQYSVTSAANVQYNFLEGAQGISTYSLSSSDTFQYFYLKAADDCVNHLLVKGCQILANLCVMQMYNLQMTVCALYMATTLARSPNAVDGYSVSDMAWLYYKSTATAVLSKGQVQTNVTFDPNDPSSVNLMQFQMAVFGLDGTFEGFQALTDQLILCPHSLEDSKNYREFGTNVNIQCSLDLTSYITAAETKFYELYFVDQDGTLLDVPLVIQNLMAEDGSFPNQGSDTSKWQLTRKFFIYDNVSGIGIAGGYLKGSTPSVIQYLTSATIRFTLRSDVEERIYIPYLILNYKARTVVYIEGTDSTDTSSFTSEYGMDTSHFWTIAEGIFIGTNVLVFLCWVVRLYVWTKINPQKDSPTTYTRWIFLTGIRMLISTWAFIHFWYLFSLTGYWFIFYKMQYHVYVLIPPLTTWSQNYYPFVTMLALVIAGCLFNALYNVYRQVNLDLILIDWEKPNRNPLARNNIEEAVGESAVYKEYVSAWRYLFIVNELNELQSQRYISVEFTFFLFLFFLDGLGWDQLSNAEPNTNVGSLSTDNSPSNPVLHYFLTCALLLIIGYLQYVVRKVLSTWFATPVQNFMDLCSVANISVLVLDEYLHGYYIHGISPNGFSELSIDELLESLHKEASGKSRARGILPEDKSGLQSFEVFIPTAIRKTYNFLARQPVDAGIIDYNESRKEASGLPSLPQALPENMSIQRVQEIRLELNRRLKIYIAGLVKDSNTQILDKSALQRFLKMPPVDLSLLDGTPYFYRDPGIGFESSFLMGKEFSFLMMDIMLFELFGYVTGNNYIGVLLAYLCSKIVSYIRQKAGEWNLSRKSLVNQRFLL